MKKSDEEVVTEVLTRMLNGKVIRRHHVRAVGDIASARGVPTFLGESYDARLRRIIKTIREQENG